MPYASVSELYGEDFGKTPNYDIAQNYGARNISDFNQTSIPDTALNMEVGTANMDIVKFNQQAQSQQHSRQSLQYDEPDYRFGLESSNDVVEKFNSKPQTVSLHDRFLEHFSQCSTCRNKVWEKFSDHIIKKKNTNSDIREMFSQNDVPPSADKSSSNDGNNYIDIIVMIMLGIFIIFVLDAFVKLGQSVAKTTQ